MTEAGTSAQPDLFEKPPPGIALGAGERAKAVEQLQMLLIGSDGRPERIGTETGDDEDHA